jgi:hypothetical protein
MHYGVHYMSYIKEPAMTVFWGASNGGNQMVETTISKQKFEELNQASTEQETTPETLLNKALEQFIEDID